MGQSSLHTLYPAWCHVTPEKTVSTVSSKEYFYNFRRVIRKLVDQSGWNNKKKGKVWQAGVTWAMVSLLSRVKNCLWSTIRNWWWYGWLSFMQRAVRRPSSMGWGNQGSKKTPSSRPWQVDFPFGQVTFSPSLPDGQGPRQAVRRLNFDNDFEKKRRALGSRVMMSLVEAWWKLQSVALFWVKGCQACDQNLPRSNFFSG